MKNSDMKVIAIILSIALFFTIVTSNAVSIASVVFLAKGETAAEGTVGETGDATNSGATDSGATNSGATDSGATNSGTATVETTAPAANSGSTADTTAPAANSGSTADTTAPAGDANKPAGDANKPADNAPASKIDKEALAMYQKAAKEINTKGNASYNKKVWQAIKSFNMGSLPSFAQNLILEVIKGAMKTEDQAEDKLYEKGDASKGHMGPSNCTEATVESVTKAKSGANTVVTIVMKDQKNPAREDKDGINAMVTGDILYITDVYSTLESNAALKAVVKLDSEKSYINYKAFTIKAVIDANGRFVSIDMSSEGEIAANINGSIDATGGMDFFVRYTNFKY